MLGYFKLGLQLRLELHFLLALEIYKGKIDMNKELKIEPTPPPS